MAGKIRRDSRYNNLTQVVENNGALIFVPPRRPLVKKNYSDNITHTVMSTDTVDYISYIYYGSEIYGWVIADFNSLLFPDRDLQNLETVVVPSKTTLFTEILPTLNLNV